MSLSIFFEWRGVAIITGMMQVICGLILHFYPPKKINSIYGFRTSKSMQSQESWDKGNKYSSKLMIYSGVIFVLYADSIPQSV